MNPKPITLLAALLISTLTARAQFQPLGVISVKNYDSMMNGAVRIQKALEETKPDLRKEFLRQAGNPDGTGIDMKRPWHFAFALPMPPTGGGTAFFVPVTNFEEFKNALEEDGMFKGRGGGNVIRKSGKYAVIIQRNRFQPPLEADMAKSIADYHKQLPTKISKTYRLHLKLTDPIRAMMKGGLQGLRAMTTAQSPKAPKDAPNPLASLGAIMDFYYVVGEMLVDGLSEIEIDADVTDDEIRLFERIKAVPDTELAKLLAPSKGRIGHLARYLDGNATVSFIGHLSGSDFLKELAGKAMTLGAQMQGGKKDENVEKKMRDMMGRMLPMKFAGSFDMSPAIEMAGIYEFPKLNGKQMKKDMVELINLTAEAQVGKDGLYSSFKHDTNVRKVNGVSVDRVTANINTNSAMLNLPGQLEAFRMMWPDDKLTYEMAVKGRQMFYAMGVPMEQAMTPAKSPAKLRVSIDDDTFVAGRYNILSVISQWLPQQKGIPAQMAEIVKQLDPKGTGVDMKANLDGALASEVVVPLKLLTQFSRFGKAMSKSRSTARATSEPKAP